MKALSKFNQIFIHRMPVDFRRGIFSLVSLVQDELELNPFSNYLFIFTNSNRNRLRMLYWDKTGFAMWYKVLEKNKFYWPLSLDGECIEIDRKVLSELLAGFDPWQEGHQEVKYSLT
jgi:transposase